MSETDEIAAVVQENFKKLPAKRKPPVRDNGLHEWVPLSGIVAKGVHPSHGVHTRSKLTLHLPRPKRAEMSFISNRNEVPAGLEALGIQRCSNT